ncbi:hypothetical protein D9M68_898370 [compost metagenome]
MDQAGAGLFDAAAPGDVSIQVLHSIDVDACVDGGGGQIVAPRLGEAVQAAAVAAQGQGGVRHDGALRVLGRTHVRGPPVGAARQDVAHGGVGHDDVVADVDDVQALAGDDVAQL